MHRLGRFAANSLLVGGIGGTAAVAVFLVVWNGWQPSLAHDMPLSTLIAGCMAVPFALAHYFASYALLGLGQVKRFGALFFIDGIGQTGLLGHFPVSGQLGVARCHSGPVTGYMTCALVAVVWLVRPVLATLRPDRPLLRGALSYGLRLYPVAIMQYLNLRFDQFLVEYLAGAVPLGLYAAVVSMTEAAWQIPIALAMALFLGFRLQPTGKLTSSHLGCYALRWP